MELAKRENDITLISWDVDSQRNELMVKELKALGVSKAFAFEVDITDDEQVAAAAKRVTENSKKIILEACANMTHLLFHI